MIKPYTAVGLIPTVRGIRTWADIKINLEHLSHLYPKNLYLQRTPMKYAEYREQVIKRQIRLMHERNIWVEPER